MRVCDAFIVSEVERTRLEAQSSFLIRRGYSRYGSNLCSLREVEVRMVRAIFANMSNRVERGYWSENISGRLANYHKNLQPANDKKAIRREMYIGKYAGTWSV